jgi:predicted O-methyltransferase YrrM
MAGRLRACSDGERGGRQRRALAPQDPLPARQDARQRTHRRRRARAIRSHVPHGSRTLKLWEDVDRYITGALVQPDAALEAALAASDAAGLPQISVSPAHGKLLWLLARLVDARRILEIGTLGGYSTIWLARGLAKGGRLVTLEAVEKHAAVARKNIAHAGLASVVDVRVGQALDTLPNVEGPIDLSFIDADKHNNAEYFRWALKLSRPGSLIVVDNVVRDGKVIDERSRDASVLGVRRLNELLANEKRVSATAIQTVGIKGYDGFAVALVLG